MQLYFWKNYILSAPIWAVQQINNLSQSVCFSQWVIYFCPTISDYEFSLAQSGEVCTCMVCSILFPFTFYFVVPMHAQQFGWHNTYAYPISVCPTYVNACVQYCVLKYNHHVGQDHQCLSTSLLHVLLKICMNSLTLCTYAGID